MGEPVIELITGDTPGKQRERKRSSVFAPQANHQYPEELPILKSNPIDILVCTDVLSEGQKLTGCREY